MKTFLLALALLLLAGCAATPAAPAAPAAPAPQNLTTCEFVARWSDWFTLATTGSADAAKSINSETVLNSHVVALQAAVAEIEAIHVDPTGALFRRDTLNALKHAVILFEWLRDEGEDAFIRPAFQEELSRYMENLKALNETAAGLSVFCAATE